MSDEWGDPVYGKLNPQVKEKWLEALRSGRYVQGKNFLRCESGYCCLGVRNDLAVQAGAISPPQDLGGEWEYAGMTGMPSDTETAWAYGIQITDQSSMIDAMTADEFLAQLNDDGESFLRIADWIEENL